MFHCCAVVVTDIKELCLELNRDLGYKVETEEVVVRRKIYTRTESKNAEFVNNKLVILK